MKPETKIRAKLHEKFRNVIHSPALPVSYEFVKSIIKDNY